MNKQQEKGVVKYQSKSGKDIELSFDLVRKYLVHGNRELVNIQEMMIFMGVCKERGLNPFAKDCYLIKYTAEEPAAIVTSIDFFRSRAKAQQDCKGWDCGIIVETKKGEIKYSHGLLRNGEKLIGGWFKGYSSRWDHPKDLEVNLSGYIKRKRTGEPTRFWVPENQPTMIAKVAESQGLRSLWPDEFQGLYTSEEMEGGLRHDIIDIKGEAEGLVDQETLEKWENLLAEKCKDTGIPENLPAFIEATAKANDPPISEEQLKAAAVEDFDDFWGQFEKWDKKQRKAKPIEPEKKKEPEPEKKVGDCYYCGKETSGEVGCQIHGVFFICDECAEAQPGCPQCYSEGAEPEMEKGEETEGEPSNEFFNLQLKLMQKVKDIRTPFQAKKWIPTTITPKKVNLLMARLDTIHVPPKIEQSALLTIYKEMGIRIG